MSQKQAIKNKIDEIASVTITSLNEVEIPGVKQGLLGASLFLYHYGRFNADRSYAKIARKVMYQVIENIDTIDRSHHPNMEIAELGWFLEYVKENQFSKINSNEYLAELDEVLYNNMIAKSAKNDFDTTFGGIVNGFYFLKRINSDSSFTSCIEKLINSIKNSLNAQDGIFSIADLGVGLSHGIAGILLFLIKCHEKNIMPEVTYGLIAQLAENIWLLRNAKPCKYIFPITINDIDPYQSRYSCWSYADPGILYSLYRAAEVLSDQPAKIQVINLFESITRYKEEIFEGLRKGDASIWYGTSGQILTYDAMYRLTHKEIFLQAANFWVEKTLELADSTSKTSAAGYNRVFNFPQHYKSELSVMTGIYGIGLTLMSYLDSSHNCFREFIYMV